MSLEASGRRTKHEELTQTLLEMVARLPVGERLPSQTELMRRYEVSDRTVLRSLEDLRRDGWIVRRRGSGTFVADRQENAPVERAVASLASRPTVAALALTPYPSPFYHRCLELLAQIAEDAGCALVCHHAPYDLDVDEHLPLEALHPKGFVAFNYALHPIAARLQERGHRAVILGAPPVGEYPQVPCVYGDHEQGGYLATRHLLELGHRRLAFARSSPAAGVPLERSLRWRGHERALREARQQSGVSSDVLDSATLGAWRSDPFLAEAYFRRPDAPTALVFWNDSEAIQLLSVLKHAGIRVPEDVSVVGYDALPESEACLPPLTTVDQHLDAQLRAVLDLLSREELPPFPQSVVVVPELVVRASSAPPSN